jgi:hypothetical protein
MHLEGNLATCRWPKMSVRASDWRAKGRASSLSYFVHSAPGQRTRCLDFTFGFRSFRNVSRASLTELVPVVARSRAHWNACSLVLHSRVDTFVRGLTIVLRPNSWMRNLTEKSHTSSHRPHDNCMTSKPIKTSDNTKTDIEQFS